MRPRTSPTVAPPRALHRRFFRVGPVADHGLYPGEPENCRRSLRRFWPVMVHLGLLLAVLRVYHVEGRALQLLTAIALAALPVHYALPYRFKRAFFVVVSIAGLACVFGPATAGIVLGCASALIGVCYLPARWSVRAATVGVLAAALTAARAWRPGIVPDGVWPVLGSMFMFRMLLYLYELKHAGRPEPLLDTIGYFFLLPNYAFLLFPVVDYRAYRRGYFAGEVHATQRAGLRLMVRGTCHLLLYRLVYHDLLVTADEVRDVQGLLLHLVGNALLYLRVSGQFHLASGMLHLFGFQLPETHRCYFLASGFTDYWRRINIYWKDFMVRIVFNPVALGLRRWPQRWSLAAATVAVFVATWGLHAYQSFWLRGAWGLSLPDALFWGVLGVLVLVNVQIDARRRPGRESAGIVRGLKTVGTFLTLALLWSLWSSPSLGAWLAMLRRAVG